MRRTYRQFAQSIGMIALQTAKNKENEMLNAKRGILVFVLLLALLSVLSLALAQDEELVFGDLPRSETFIVASQAPHNDVWDSFNYYQARNLQ